MLPMTTAAHKPPETTDEMIHRLHTVGAMNRTDAQRVLALCVDNKLYYELNLCGLVQQAIAVKLAGL